MRKERNAMDPPGESVAPGVLIVGNFQSTWDRNPGVCEELAARLVSSGWSVVTTSARLGRLARLLDMVRTTWGQRYRYDVAHVDVFSGPAFFWAEAVCWTLRLARKPYILTLRGGDLPTFARCWPKRVRYLLNSAAEVTTPSPYLVEHMHPFYANLRLLANPLDLSAYGFRQRDRPRPRLVWLRAFHATYNPLLAVQVMGLLALDFPDIHLTMIGPDKGDGSLRRLQQECAELGVSDSIALLGRIPKVKVPECINKGDIFLNTTNVDNTPISVLEAMACGLCVISTNVGGIPYLLEHEYDAILVPPNDPDAMAAAVRRVLTEPGLAKRLSINARQKAEQFDWSAFLPQWTALVHNPLLHRS
jgi:glycosyltransferase involved in cell wall biosynthesis